MSDSPSVELVPATIEITDHEDLFRTRLHELEEDLATGRFGAPILCLAGLEVEFQLSENNSPEPARKAAERQTRIAQIREEAEAHIQGLIQNATDEPTRQVYESWLPQLDAFNATDWLNFRLYQEFSRPTPMPVHAPYGASYGDMRSYSAQAGWLECRFGKEGFQRGYYDLGKNCEIRFAPCSPSGLVERSAIVMQRVYQLCEDLHLSYTSVVDHPNLSLYTKQGDQYRPVIGNDPARLDTTLDIVAGLSAALEVGTCIAPQTITDTNLIRRNLPSFFMVSRFRDHVRIKDDYLEWRAFEFGSSSNAHKLLWLTAGTTFGLECGVDYVTQNLETGYPYLEESVLTHRTPNFRRDRDLALQRILDYATPGNDGRLVPGSRLEDVYAYMLIGSLFNEDTSREVAMGLVRGYLYALDADDEGRIFIDRAVWDEQFPGMSESQSEELLSPLERLLNQDGLRLSMGESIKSYPVFFDTTVAGRSLYWNHCEIMHRTYGPYTEAYIAFLRDLEEATATSPQPPPPPEKLVMSLVLRGDYL